MKYFGFRKAAKHVPDTGAVPHGEKEQKALVRLLAQLSRWGREQYSGRKKLRVRRARRRTLPLWRVLTLSTLMQVYAMFMMLW